MQFSLSVDGGVFKNYSFLEANEFFNSDISGTTFTFMRDTTSSNPDFYVSALAVEQVPVPGTLALVASGLGGLGFLRWRRKKKAAVIAA
jgi:hypothetical protein